ncbi:MAG: hypothetical protein NVSMB19_25030 [Vulcanimicrobiaceae bacterium]
MFSAVTKWFERLKGERDRARDVIAQATNDAAGEHGHTHAHVDGVTHTHGHDHHDHDHDHEHRVDAAGR